MSEVEIRKGGVIRRKGGKKPVHKKTLAQRVLADCIAKGIMEKESVHKNATAQDSFRGHRGMGKAPTRQKRQTDQVMICSCHR